MIIRDYIQANNVKLLGEIEVNEQEFNGLKDYLKDQITRRTVSTDANLYIALALVQIAIRYYDNRFWESLYQVLNISPLPLNKQIALGKIFLNTIRRYNLLELPNLPTGENQYVENIKFHAIVPNAYIGTYCTFLYDYYQKVLNPLTEDKAEFQDMLSILSDEIKKKVNQESNTITSNKSAASRAYTLLKPSRQVFALTSQDKLSKIFYPVFKTVDSCYYGEENCPCGTRLQRTFYDWYKQAQRQDSEGNYLSHHKEIIKKAPYIKVNFNSEYSSLYFPKYKFRLEESELNREQKAIFDITIGSKTLRQTNKVEEYLGTGITEEFERAFPNDCIFNEIKTCVYTDYGKTIKNYTFPESNYRIINRENEVCDKLTKGVNYLIVKKGVAIEVTNAEICSVEEQPCWNFYAINNADENTRIQIEGETLCLNSIFGHVPVFSGKFDGFKVFKDNQPITAAINHPVISFAVECDLFDRASIIINEERYFLKDINISEKAEINNLYLVNLRVENIATNKKGIFDIYLDIPNQNKKLLAQYILFEKGFYSFDKKLYVEEEYANLTVKGIDVCRVNEAASSLTGKCGSTYVIPLTCDEVNISFTSDNQELSLNLPIPLFKYGSKSSAMKRKTKGDFLWYDKTPVYFDTCNQWTIISVEDNSQPDGWREKANSDFATMYNGFYEISLDEKEKNSNRKIKVSIVSREPIIIDRKNKIEVLPEKLSLQTDTGKNNLQYIKIDKITAKEYAKLMVDIIDHNTGKKIYDGKELKEGINELPELSFTGNYDLHAFMRESDILSKDTALENLVNLSVFPLDIEPSWQLKKIVESDGGMSVGGNSRIELKKKESPNVYIGELSYRNEQDSDGANITKYEVKVIVIQKEDNKLSVSLKIKDENGEWIYPFFSGYTGHYLTNCPAEDESFQLNAGSIAILKLN